MTRKTPAPAPPEPLVDEFAALVREHQQPVFQLCLRLLGRPAEAEEAAQETFLRAYAALARYDRARPFMSWAAEIALNICRDRLRAGRWWRFFVDEGEGARQPSEHPLADEELRRAEEQRALVLGLQELSAPDREALALFADALPAEEAARLLGITPNALYVRQSRARARLAEVLRRRYPELFDSGR